MAKSVQFTIQPGGYLQGNIRIPGDKSISHRAIMLGAIAEGSSHVTGFLEGEDCLATLAAFKAMGVNVEHLNAGELQIHGVGLHGLQAPKHTLDLGNSGTSIRLLAGLLAGQTFDSVLTGDESLLKRPMARVVDPLQKMGAKIDMQVNGTAPLTIHAQQTLTGIHYQMPVVSAQVKSCLLLAGLYAQGQTVVSEPGLARDHTERMLKTFGYPISVNHHTIKIKGQHPLTATSLKIPADISSAAFFMVGASISPKSNIVLEQVGINPTRIGVINILRMMGADIKLQNEMQFGEEPIADVYVRSATLRGIEIPLDQVPLAIDEFPALFIAAACAKGTTILRGAKELRVKESDRILSMANGLTTLGIKTEVFPDGIAIEGGKLGSGTIDSYGDHRIAMAFAMAALRANGDICITDCENVATSFPNFETLAKQAGLSLHTTISDQ